MQKKKYMFHLLYFGVTGIIATYYLLITLKARSNSTYNEAITMNYYMVRTKDDVEDDAITTREILIPDESEVKELEKLYDELIICVEKIDIIKEEISEFYNDVSNAPVCSIANYHFNLLSEKHNEWQKLLSEIQEKINIYEQKYKEYVGIISEIPQYSRIYREKYKEFQDNIEPKYNIVTKKIVKLKEDEQNICTTYELAKGIADTFYEEYYELMSHIVNAEAGLITCTAEDRWYVANVIENRIKHTEYPDTLYDVIYQPGQYEPVSKGTIDQTPSKMVYEDVEEYLRGRVDTGMPDNVVYQAQFEQGSDTWIYMPTSNHYFCFY